MSSLWSIKWTIHFGCCQSVRNMTLLCPICPKCPCRLGVNPSDQTEYLSQLWCTDNLGFSWAPSGSHTSCRWERGSGAVGAAGQLAACPAPGGGLCRSRCHRPWGGLAPCPGVPPDFNTLSEIGCTSKSSYDLACSTALLKMAWAEAL